MFRFGLIDRDKLDNPFFPFSLIKKTNRRGFEENLLHCRGFHDLSGLEFFFDLNNFNMFDDFLDKAINIHFIHIIRFIFQI